MGKTKNIRNKKDSYENSLDRNLWQEELELLLNSQKENKELFKDKNIFEEFKNKIINGINENSLGVFEQRDLKSVEEMVGFCSFYNYYSQNPQKRVVNANIKAIEFILRQRVENSILGNLIFNKDTGEFTQVSNEDIETTINFWLKTPNAQKITAKNIFKNAGIRNLEIKTVDKQDDTVQDISLHKALLEIVDFEIIIKHKEFYSKLLEILHYFVSKEQIKDEIKKLDSQNILSAEQIDKISILNKNTSSYLSFSLKFIEEILEKLKNLLEDDGKLIIEVPNANDALLTIYENEAFSNFTYWSCHLYLYTQHTLNLLAKQAGFKVEFIKHIQRYPLSNHLYWLSFNKAGGHEKWGGYLDSKELNQAYENQLATLGATDTLIACFKKELN